MDEQNARRPQSDVLRAFATREQTRAYYNKLARVYDLLAEHCEAPIRRAGIEKLNVQPGQRVLEIGFGTGHSLVQLAQRAGAAGQVYGLDLSDKMVEVARDNVGKAGFSSNVTLTCGDAARLPYPDESMDAVFMSFTLELFDTPEIPQVLAECKRVLRRGGRIMVIGMSKEGGNVLERLAEWAHRHFPNFVDCRPIHVRAALETAGFIISSAEIRNMWVPVELVLALRAPLGDQ